MSTEVRVPLDLWAQDDQTGSIVVWLYADGAQVREGQLIAEILVEKTTLELEAPATGTLRIRMEPEVVLEKGDLVAIIE